MKGLEIHVPFLFDSPQSPFLSRFCYLEHSINSNFGLPDHCNVFQTEVAAIKVAVDRVGSAASFREVKILTHASCKSCLEVWSCFGAIWKHINTFLWTIHLTSGWSSKTWCHIFIEQGELIGIDISRLNRFLTSPKPHLTYSAFIPY